MARLPVPGQDSNTWGTILNEFLDVSHNADGTLDSTAVTNAGAITQTTADGRYVQSTEVGAASGVASLDSSSHVPLAQLANITANLRYRGAWAASTAYLTNDLITHGEVAYVATAGFTSGTSFSLSNLSAPNQQSHVFNVMAYGAKGDGSTDDTAAINAAISAAITAGQADGTNYAEIYFPVAKYVIAGAPTQGGTNKCNAQIPLPLMPEASEKFTLVFRGTKDSSPIPHWYQTVPVDSGVVLSCTRTDGTDNATYGAASVIGGPTLQQGYGKNATFSNMLVVIDGITIQVPQDSTYCGFDFRGVAEANVINGSVMANAVPSQMWPIAITNQWTWGLAMPLTGNNDNCNVGIFSCEGLCYGFMPSEHTQATSVRCLYCIIGIMAASGDGQNMPHAAWIGYASVEYCTQGIGFADGIPKINISVFDCESLTYFVYDPNNRGVGTINCFGETPGINATPGGAFVDGGDLLRVIDCNWASGHVNPAVAPAVPATGVAWQNGFWRDAAVVVSGGTVTGIAVDGVNVGVTSGTVMVPSGKNITITYSSAPTWSWILF